MKTVPKIMTPEPCELLKALAVDTRIRIINLLKSKGALGTNTISELLGITPSAVSQHLRVLKQAGLVTSERKGYWVPHSVNEEGLEKCRQVLNEVCTCGRTYTCEFTDQDLGVASLEFLREYEGKLETELAAVRASISEADASGTK